MQQGMIVMHFEIPTVSLNSARMVLHVHRKPGRFLQQSIPTRLQRHVRFVAYIYPPSFGHYGPQRSCKARQDLGQPVVPSVVPAVVHFTFRGLPQGAKRLASPLRITPFLRVLLSNFRGKHISRVLCRNAAFISVELQFSAYNNVYAVQLDESQAGMGAGRDAGTGLGTGGSMDA